MFLLDIYDTMMIFFWRKKGIWAPNQSDSSKAHVKESLVQIDGAS